MLENHASDNLFRCASGQFRVARFIHLIRSIARVLFIVTKYYGMQFCL